MNRKRQWMPTSGTSVTRASRAVTLDTRAQVPANKAGSVLRSIECHECKTLPPYQPGARYLVMDSIRGVPKSALVTLVRFRLYSLSLIYLLTREIHLQDQHRSERHTSVIPRDTRATRKRLWMDRVSVTSARD